MIAKSVKNKNANVKIEEIIKLAIDAGKILIAHQKKLSSLNVTHKAALGVVSEADHKSEAFILKNLKKRFPDHFFLAEESSYEQFGNDAEKLNQFKEKEYCWSIDPLDGTTNYLSGMDYYAVCIGLLKKGLPILGVVHRPSTGETFYAIKGKGAFLKKGSGKPINLYQKNNKKDLKESLVVTGFAGEKGERIQQEFELFRSIVKGTRGVRRMGSAALDMCYVSQGIFDSFWERGLAPWDVSASGIICQEAGVKLSDYSGSKFHPFQKSILGARPPFHTKFLKLLAHH